jgi:transcriptional regulator of acetoin/glycerol metabolism
LRALTRDGLVPGAHLSATFWLPLKTRGTLYVMLTETAKVDSWLNFQPPRHVPSVTWAIEGPGDRELDEVSASWRRSAERHHIDPQSTAAPQILTADELRERREPIESVVLAAQPELDRLYAIVRQPGYVVLLCDPTGIAVDHRASDERSAQLRYWGIWSGAVWSEEAEGTNGIGTCIAERRPITVHQTQHFRARHISLSCSGSPVFGPEGELAAAIDASSIDPSVSAHSHALTLPLVAAAARAHEERLFRERFARAWIIALAPLSDEQLAPLLAIDRDYRILGADRCARAQFGITPERLQSGLSLSTLFAPGSSLLQRKDGGVDTLVGLKEVGGIESRCALVSPPALSLRARMSACDATFLMRPRSMLLVSLERHFFVQPPSGGLPAGVLRRICEHIESHLEDNISLEVLAADAGFSLYHFARAFRQSMGISPHRYVMQQRVRKAQQLLARTDLPLATIAAAVGFADQSHFSRQFRRLAGTTPSGFRRAKR